MKPVYDDIWQRGSELISSGNSEPDYQIDNSDDSRRGITLILRPSANILEGYGDFLKLAEAVEPAQYQYAPSEIHMTVMSIITCAENFSLDQIDAVEYSKLVQFCVRQIDPFVVDFKGITVTASCVMAQGFPADGSLKKLRELLREKFGSSSLRHSIDGRYEIATAHSTLIRFRDELSRPREFVDLLSQFRNVEWGRQHVASLDLVFNDWYHKSSRVENIANFHL
jgi:2'-5' RNA ligase